MTDTSVLIIGGGIAALAACRDLAAKGIKVTIIEAQNRLGGRIKTVSLGQAKYDLGASWMHETSLNPLFQEAAKHGIKMKYDDNDFRYYLYGHGEISKADGTIEAAKDISDMAKIDYLMEKPRRPDISLRDYSIEFAETWPLISETNKQRLPRFMQLWESWTALSWTESPAAGAVSEFLGRNAFVTEGYEKIWDWLWKQVDWSHVQIVKESPVVKIDTLGAEAGGYCVTVDKNFGTANAGKDTIQYTAEYVICTIPQGHLVKYHETLFPLELPPRLRSTMEHARMGALGKIIMEFDDMFWDYDVDQLYIFADKPAREDLPLEPGNCILNITNALKDNKTPALVILITPPLTEYLEANPDKIPEFMAPGLELIRKDKTKPVPAAKTILITDWTQNPFFLGSYSSTPVNGDFNGDVQSFIDGADHLRFAGEHTTYDGPGCVHGAYLSGIREAAVVGDYISGEFD